MENNTIVANPQERLNFVIDTAWKILFERICSGLQKINNKEASLQLHFAKLISELGNAYCILEGEKFEMELEHNYKNERKSIDIVCSLTKTVMAAIELKFFRKASGAQDINCYDALVDVQRLQHFKDFAIRKFFCLADSNYYLKEKTKGHIKIVSLENGKEYKAHIPVIPSWINSFKDKSRNMPLVFEQDFECEWVQKSDSTWCYLQIDVPSDL